MALETLSVQYATRPGAVIALQSATAAGGFQFANNGRTLLYFENDAADCELVFTIPVTVDGQSGLSRTVDVTANEKWIMGPFPVDQYNDSDGNVFCTPEQVTITNLIGLISL